MLNFQILVKIKKKIRYYYLLTPKGIREKSLITSRFLERKKLEYKLLEKEIAQLEQDSGLDIKS